MTVHDKHDERKNERIFGGTATATHNKLKLLHYSFIQLKFAFS